MSLILVCPQCQAGTPGHLPAAKGLFIDLADVIEAWIKVPGKRGKVLHLKPRVRCRDCGYCWYTRHYKRQNAS